MHFLKLTMPSGDSCLVNAELISAVYKSQKRPEAGTYVEYVCRANEQDFVYVCESTAEIGKLLAQLGAVVLGPPPAVPNSRELQV